ncbi:HP1 family phage holin [Enterobacter roggenkampii]|uniref:Holin n=1 Tax=Leclercia barmai TaxID=2785629 RepID=A0ABS7RS82_9ENTR|nr:holin [Citrobacter freundii]MBZ0057175.1 holin [Leclercia sp. EMC7]MCM5695350.1 phage holin family protein [Leclercia sp. LTM01]MCM5699756.1 phage holin family protein [Leclercia sp. LTM14]
MGRFWEWITYRVGLITAAMATLSLNEWAVLIGIGCTLVTCGVNWYYERRRTLIAEGAVSGK